MSEAWLVNCGRQSGNAVGFLRVLSFLLPSHIPPNTPFLSPIYRSGVIPAPLHPEYQEA
jgi:hypothetical protein